MKANDLQLTVENQKNNLLNKLLIVLNLLVLLAVIGSLTRYFEIGWHNVMALHLVILIFLGAITWYREQVPYLYKAWTIVSLFFIAALAGLLSFGLVGGNIGIWFTLPLFAVALINSRVAMMMIGLTLVIFVVVAWLSIHGLIHANIDYDKLIHSTSIWLCAIFAIPLFAYMPVLIISNLDSINQRLMENLNFQNKELERLNNVKDTMFSVIAHDLRTPFQGLIGALELIEDEDGIENTRIFSELLKNVRGTHLMLENLLVWAQSELQESQLDAKQHLLANLISEACAPYHQIAQNKDIHISLQVEPTLKLFCDSASFKIVLANLLFNAIKFSYSDSGITISAHQQADQLSIAIQDSGVGISPQQIEKILDANQTYTTYGTGNEKGVGLGMKICQKLVKQNAGTLHIDSVMGKGSTMTISFPIRQLQSINLQMVRLTEGQRHITEEA